MTHDAASPVRPARVATRVAAMRVATVVAGVVVAAGCATATRPAADNVERAGLADRVAAAGDFEEAVRLYERALETNPNSPVLRERLENVRRRAAQARAARALDAAARGAPDEARAQIEAAVALGPDVPAVQRARHELETTLQGAAAAAEAKAAAEKLLRSDPAAARDLLAEARRRAPLDPELVRMLSEATLRTEAVRAAGDAATAWEAGRRDDAVRVLATATFGGTPVRAAELLRVRIEDDLLRETVSSTAPDTLRRSLDLGLAAELSTTTTRTLRERLVQALRAEATRLLAAGRPALAALHETECLRLGAVIPTPALDAVAERARVVIAVLPFEDATGGDVDGLRLAAALAARIEADARGGGAALGVIAPGADQAALIVATPRALLLSGVVRGRSVVVGTRVTGTREIPYVAGTRLQRNPAADRLESDLQDVEARLADVRRQIRVAADELHRLEALPFPRGASRERVGSGRADFEMAIARAESRIAGLRERESDLAGERSSLGAQLTGTPPDHPVAETALAVVEVTTYRKVADLTASITLRSGDETLLDETVTGAVRHDETISPGAPAAGVAADPDEAPDDAEIARLAVARFAALAAGRVRAAAESAARAFLVDARTAERAGESAAAAEGYALYLLSTAEVASPHRADAAQALAELTGVRVPLRTGAEEPR